MRGDFVTPGINVMQGRPEIVADGLQLRLQPGVEFVA